MEPQRHMKFCWLVMGVMRTLTKFGTKFSPFTQSITLSAPKIHLFGRKGEKYASAMTKAWMTNDASLQEFISICISLLWFTGRSLHTWTNLKTRNIQSVKDFIRALCTGWHRVSEVGQRQVDKRVDNWSYKSKRRKNYLVWDSWTEKNGRKKKWKT